MRIYKTTRLTGVLLALLFLAFTGGTADAITYSLTAGTTTITMPDGTSVPAWGYAITASEPGGTAADGIIKVPGDPLTVPPGDTTLTIQLTNNLTEATSLIILGQRLDGGGAPTYDGGRVLSFSPEVAAGGVLTYTWSNFKPGTYMLQSGTNPAKQVQMGLYAAVKQDIVAPVAGTSPGEAYAGVLYDEELIVVFHDIDPIINNAIATNNYGPGTAIPSSVYREPTYFLINGKAYPDVDLNPLFTATTGKRLLVRIINAGLITHVPQFYGTYMTLVAEDGNKYVYNKEQTGVELPPAKRVDAIVIPEEGQYALYDARLKLSNAGTYQGTPAGGGMMAYLRVGVGAGAPVANADAYPVAPVVYSEDSGPFAVAATEGLLANDTAADGTALPSTATAELVSYAGPGALTLNPDGSFSYTPALNFNGTDSFTYRVSDGTNFSNPASVTITITAANDPPVASADAYTSTATVQLAVPAPGVLGNDSDVDGDPLTAALASGPSNGGTLALNADGSFTYTYPSNPAATLTDTFTYTASDGQGGSATATVTITVNPQVNTPPVAVNDSVTVSRPAGSVTVNVVANDTDAEGNLDPGSVAITRVPRSGTLTNNRNGTVTWTAPSATYMGRVDFQYTVRDTAGALSNVATAYIYVTR